MRDLIFATGNANKFYEASSVFSNVGVTLIQRNIDIDEIQHHDSRIITEAKARAAFDVMHKPLVVNDSSWEIPALGGFPGGYMKDVSEWLSDEDFMSLMRFKSDKRIFLNEYVCFFDGERLEIFINRREGHFIDSPMGNSGPSFAKVVMMNTDTITISQIFDKGNWSTDSESEYKHWYDCARWCKENI